MTKIYKAIIAALFFACTSLFASQANARVCFATDPDCGSGGNFGDYDPEPLNNACIKEGYNCDSLSGCSCNAETQIKYNCPYKTPWLKCCGKEYFYAACTYPLQINGECGGKYKCRCDRTKFGYNDNYTATSCEKQYPGSLAGGGSCVETFFDIDEKALKTDIYYSDCICNRATYPYLKEDCANGTEPSADGCTGTDGITRYTSCICNTAIYPYQPGDCEFGGNMDKKEYYCIQGGSYHFKLCYNCDAFPATSLDHALEYTKCTYGNRYNITKCEKGYRPGVGGDNCRELTCEEAVDEWFDTYPSYKNTYTLIASDKNIRESNLKHAVSSSAYITTPYAILAADQTVSTMYAGITYYGASAFGKNRGGYMAERCKLRPVITYTNNGFSAKPGTSLSTAGKVNLYGMKLKFTTNTFKTSYGINAVNTDIYATNWEIPNTVDYAPSFTYNAAYDNEGYEALPSINVSGTMTIKSYFSSNGYSYNTESGYSWGTINIAFPDSYKNQEIAKFTFKENQEFKVRNVYVIPLNSSDCSGSTENCRIDYGTKVSFIGPASEEAANVYTNIQLGYGRLDNATKAGRNIYAEISGHLIWNMYKGSTDYSIALSAGSKLYSTNYGVGEYAYIKRGSDSKWSWCYMDRNQLYSDRTKNAVLCTGSCKNRENYNNNYFAICSKTKSGQSMLGNVYYTAKGATNCSCSQNSTSIDWNNCTFSAGGYTQTPIYCGE